MQQPTANSQHILHENQSLSKLRLGLLLSSLFVIPATSIASDLGLDSGYASSFTSKTAAIEEKVQQALDKADMGYNQSIKATDIANQANSKANKGVLITYTCASSNRSNATKLYKWRFALGAAIPVRMDNPFGNYSDCYK